MTKRYGAFILAMSAVLAMTGCNVTVTPPHIERKNETTVAAKPVQEADGKNAKESEKVTAVSTEGVTAADVRKENEPVNSGSSQEYRESNHEYAAKGPGGIQTSDETSLTWNVPNGDVIVTAMNTSDGRYKLYTDDGSRFIVVDGEGRKTFGFVFTANAGMGYLNEALDPNNEILVQTDRLVTAYIRNQTPNYYETVYMLPGCDSALVLMTEHSEAVIESAFIMLNISIEKSPNGETFEGMNVRTERESHSSSVVETAGTAAYANPANSPEEHDWTGYYSVDHVYSEFVTLIDFDEEVWTMDFPYSGMIFKEGDFLEIVVDPIFGIDRTVNKITYPKTIYRNGERVYPLY